jgi:hypothetical protein
MSTEKKRESAATAKVTNRARLMSKEKVVQKIYIYMTMQRQHKVTENTIATSSSSLKADYVTAGPNYGIQGMDPSPACLLLMRNSCASYHG